MERNKMLGLIAAVIVAVLLAIAGKSCVKDAKSKNPVVQQPTIIVSPQIVQGGDSNYSYTPPVPTSPPVQTEPPAMVTESPVTQPATVSKSKLDELWEKSAR